MNKSVLTASIALLVSLCCFALLVWQGSQETGAWTQAESDRGRLELALAEVRHQLTQLQTQRQTAFDRLEASNAVLVARLGRLEASSAKPTDSASTATWQPHQETLPDANPELEDALAEVDEHAVVQVLDMQLGSEPRDPGWSTQFEDRLIDLFAAATPDLDSDLMEAQCAKSLCRVEVRHEDAVAEAAFMQAMSQPHAVRQEIADFYYHRQDPDGTEDTLGRSVFYLARRGYSLPAEATRPARDFVASGEHDIAIPPQ